MKDFHIANAEKYFLSKYGEGAYLDGLCMCITNRRRLYRLIVISGDEAIIDYVDTNVIDDWKEISGNEVH